VKYFFQRLHTGKAQTRNAQDEPRVPATSQDTASIVLVVKRERRHAAKIEHLRATLSLPSVAYTMYHPLDEKKRRALFRVAAAATTASSSPRTAASTCAASKYVVQRKEP